MKLDRRFYVWATSTAWTFASAAQAYGNENSAKTFSHYISSSLISADPGVMVILGIGLIALRLLMARRSKRRDTDPAHFRDPIPNQFTSTK